MDHHPHVLPHVQVAIAGAGSPHPRTVRTISPGPAADPGPGRATARPGLGRRWCPCLSGHHRHRFPNLFLLTGPNSALAHNSVVPGIEAQVRYVLDALRVLRWRRLAAVEVRGTVGRTGGRRSWFLDRAGRNTTFWPGPARTTPRRQPDHEQLTMSS